MLKFASVALILTAAAPATAQTAQTSAIAPAAQPKPQINPLDRVVCRTEEGLGSRLNRKKICMSMREWKNQADDSRDAVERIQQSQGMIPSG
jgi:hypothetical protein